MRLHETPCQILKITHALDFVTNPMLQRFLGVKEVPKGTGRYTSAKRQLDKLTSDGLLQAIEIQGKSLFYNKERFYYVLTKEASELLGVEHKPLYRPRRPGEWMHDHFVNDCLLTAYLKYHLQAGLPFEVIRNLKFKHPDKHYIQPDACFIVDNKYTFILEIECSRSERKIYNDKIKPQSEIKDFTPYKTYHGPNQKEPDKIREPFKKLTILYVIADSDTDLFKRPWQITEGERQANTALMQKVIKLGKTDRFQFMPAHFFDILHLEAWTRGQGYQPLIQKIKF
jgi:hypothetical protein